MTDLKKPLIFLVLGILTLSVLHGSAQEQAAPFGLRMGTPRTEVLALVGNYSESQPGFLHVRNVPRTSPDFEAYGLIVSPTLGLCKILAVGRDLELNASGDNLKEAFAETARALDEEYGRHELYDYLKPGSLLKNPDDWTIALVKTQRVLAGTWTPAPSSGLGSILLETVAPSASVGYLELHFEGRTFGACKEELAHARRSALAR